MTPVFPDASALTAAAPKRREISRSNVVGEPPRSRCPSTTTRVSRPVAWPISAATRSPTPPSRSAEPAFFSTTA